MERLGIPQKTERDSENNMIPPRSLEDAAAGENKKRAREYHEAAAAAENKKIRAWSGRMDVAASSEHTPTVIAGGLPGLVAYLRSKKKQCERQLEEEIRCAKTQFCRRQDDYDLAISTLEMQIARERGGWLGQVPDEREQKGEAAQEAQ